MPEKYYIWLINQVCDISEIRRYSKLLQQLFETEFTWKFPLDESRADDALGLRKDYFYDANLYHYPESLESEPANVLEVMVALANRIELDIMGDPDIGNRVPKWFWEMIDSLELSAMTNDYYDDDYVDFILDRFLNREFEPNGRGSLFTVRYPKRDMRKLEIWYQMQAYLNEI